jgi:hypothetical protein
MVFVCASMLSNFFVVFIFFIQVFQVDQNFFWMRSLCRKIFSRVRETSQRRFSSINHPRASYNGFGKGMGLGLALGLAASLFLCGDWDDGTTSSSHWSSYSTCNGDDDSGNDDDGDGDGDDDDDDDNSD